MRHGFFGLLSLTCIVSMSPTSSLAQAVSLGQAGQLSEDNAEQVLQRGLDSYIRAFNAGDAEALANSWTTDGELITADGGRFRGRDALRGCFSSFFAEAKSAKLELIEPQIELLSPHVARETGTARVTAAEQESSDTNYEAIYVKSEGTWKLDSVRESAVNPGPPSHFEQLKQLEWMLGTWVDEAEDAEVETTCRWTSNRNFLVRSFKVLIGNHIDFEGTQVIGWDPSTEQIRSWMFDSDGGIGAGVWNGTEDGWTVHALNVLPDGRRASSTNIYVLLDEDTVEFRSIGRQVGGELLPSIDPIRVVRRSDDPL